MRSVFVTLGVVLVLAACASGKTAGSSNAPTTRTTINRENFISAEEVTSATGARSALDIVRQLRPRWNRSLPVFIGNSEFGGPLSDIDARSVKEIRFLPASEAQMRFGMRVQEVILVTRK
jgi:hypothetical protein